jgi:hypothetical protein
MFVFLLPDYNLPTFCKRANKSVFSQKWTWALLARLFCLNCDLFDYHDDHDFFRPCGARWLWQCADLESSTSNAEML